MADFFQDGCQLVPDFKVCRNYSENDDGSLEICSYEGTFSEKNVLVRINMENGGCIQDGRQMGSYLWVLSKSKDKMVVKWW